MKKLVLSLIAVLASFPLLAQDEEKSMDAPVEEASVEDSPLFTGSLAFTTDYRFRGVTQTNEDPALQIGLEMALPANFYAGLWASNVDFDPFNVATYELDTVIGWRGELAEGLTSDISFVRYNYLTDGPSSLEYNELIGKLGYAGFTGTIGYSDDFLNSDETAIYYNLGYGVAVADFNVSASVGYYDIDLADGNDSSITDYAIGVSKSFGSLTAGLQYINTNDGTPQLFGGLSDSTFVFTLSSAFSFL